MPQVVSLVDAWPQAFFLFGALTMGLYVVCCRSRFFICFVATSSVAEAVPHRCVLAWYRKWCWWLAVAGDAFVCSGAANMLPQAFSLHMAVMWGNPGPPFPDTMAIYRAGSAAPINIGAVWAFF